MKRKVFTLLLALTMVLSYAIPSLNPASQVYASTECSQEAAIQWARSQEGTMPRYNGGTHTTRTTLIYNYYIFLGATPKDTYYPIEYSEWTPPAGWTKVKDGTPQTGDIVIYEDAYQRPNDMHLGLIGIYDGDNNAIYAQNDPSWAPEASALSVFKYTVNEEMSTTDDEFNQDFTYWGYIRPDWMECDHQSGTTVINAKEPACEEEGYTGDTQCTNCKYIVSRGTSIPAAGHKWDSSTVLRPATKILNGLIEYKCSVCEATKRESIPKVPGFTAFYVVLCRQCPYEKDLTGSFRIKFSTDENGSVPLANYDLENGYITDSNGYLEFDIVSSSTSSTGVAVLAVPNDTWYNVEQYSFTPSDKPYYFRHSTGYSLKDQVRLKPNTYSVQILWDVWPRYPVTVSLEDEAGDPIEGGSFQILDQDKNVIADNLTAGETVDLDTTEYSKSNRDMPSLYYLHEKTAPEGYDTAEDLPFQVIPATNIVRYGGQTYTDGTVRMVNKLKPETPPENNDANSPDSSGPSPDGPSTSTPSASTPAGGIAAEGANANALNQFLLTREDDGDVPGSTFGKLAARAKKVGKKSQTIVWNAVPGAVKYNVYANKCGKKNKLLFMGSFTGTSFVHKGLKKGTYYKYMVVAVDKNGKVAASSKVIHSATKGDKAGNFKKVKTKAKKNKVNLKTGKMFKLKAKGIKGKGKVKKHRAICYETSNTAVATVNKKGVIKGVAPGKCIVYAYAQNGVFAKVTITVK